MEKYVGHDRLHGRAYVKHCAAVFTNGERVIKLTGDSQPSCKFVSPRGARGEMTSGAPSKAFGSSARNCGALLFSFGAPFKASSERLGLSHRFAIGNSKPISAPITRAATQARCR